MRNRQYLQSTGILQENLLIHIFEDEDARRNWLKHRILIEGFAKYFCKVSLPDMKINMIMSICYPERVFLLIKVDHITQIHLLFAVLWPLAMQDLRKTRPQTLIPAHAGISWGVTYCRSVKG
jgi:hypothetical protein